MRSFNPRSPRGGATCPLEWQPGTIIVSIHAPREGERQPAIRPNISFSGFNPRSPRGGATLLQSYFVVIDKQFQSTLPARGSDDWQWTEIYAGLVVSIHAPREGERHGKSVIYNGLGDGFNPRSPRGGATIIHTQYSGMQVFQSTLPARGSDYPSQALLPASAWFQSTLPARGSDTKL